MKIILLFLAALASFTVHAQPPSLTVEQTVRHIYQNYKSDATAPYFGETGERAITSARIQQALILNDNLTLPGNIGWLDYDPVCDCQDFGDLVLESVAITQTDADHADAVVRFRIFKDDKEKTKELSLRLSKELIDTVHEYFNGLYIITPFQKVDYSLELAAYSKSITANKEAIL